MSLYPPPQRLEAEVWSSLPKRLRKSGQKPDWAAANKPGQDLDCFLEGPSFDREGRLWLVDIPYGRILTIDPDGSWNVVVEYDGWPNGLKIHRDGRVFVADYRHGIMVLEPGSGSIERLIGHRYSEHFRGCNDLVFDSAGRLYFTDQGQSGLHRTDGRVYRYDLGAGRLELLLDTGPSPNGLVLNEHENLLYVAMTRDNSVWRLPLMADGGVSKVGRFVQLSGGLSGPDGMALGADGSVFVAHAGNGCVWGFSRLGEPLWRIVSPTGLTTTNLTFGGPDGRSLFITESESGTILRAELPVAGKRMFSHQ